MKFVLTCHIFCGSTCRPLVGQISVQIISYCPPKFFTEGSEDSKWMTGTRTGLKEPRCWGCCTADVWLWWCCLFGLHCSNNLLLVRNSGPNFCLHRSCHRVTWRRGLYHIISVLGDVQYTVLLLEKMTCFIRQLLNKFSAVKLLKYVVLGF